MRTSGLYEQNDLQNYNVFEKSDWRAWLGTSGVNVLCVSVAEGGKGTWGGRVLGWLWQLGEGSVGKVERGSSKAASVFKSW